MLRLDFSYGDYILKPVPRNSVARLAEDIPANLTRRFDYRDGVQIRQEDFCQLSGRSEETHGSDYKYGASYEELASLVRRFCPSAAAR